MITDAKEMSEEYLQGKQSQVFIVLMSTATMQYQSTHTELEALLWYD